MSLRYRQTQSPHQDLLLRPRPPDGNSSEHDPEDSLRAADRNPDITRSGYRAPGMGQGIPEHQLLR